VALQETNTGKHHNIAFHNYNYYSCYCHETNGTYHGGSALIINKSVPHKPIALSTNLQATAVRATLFKTITVCSAYLPPSQRFEAKDLEELYSQLPPPALLLGDFNAHSQTWDCQNLDRQGKLIEDFCLKQNVCILNTGSFIYFHPGIVVFHQYCVKWKGKVSERGRKRCYSNNKLMP